MDSSELKCLLVRTLRSTSCQFLGVFSADEAPMRLPTKASMYPCAYVVNTDDSSKPGRHWVACYASSQHAPLEFFDSYGKPPSAYPDIRLPSVQRRVRRFTTVSFQSPRSVVCGHYCVYYISKRAAGWTSSFLRRVFERFASSAKPGLPYPQDRLVRGFAKRLGASIPCKLCCTQSHRCSGVQCCTAPCKQ